MPRPMMELRQLRSFVVVAEELHFRRAADRLHLAQPSVSQQLRALEAELGIQLFERNRRGASLTPAGSALLAEARDLLRRADRAAAVARATGAGERGRLRMSLTRSLTGGIAGAIVSAYRSEYPGGRARSLSLGTTMLHVRAAPRRRDRRAEVRAARRSRMRGSRSWSSGASRWSVSSRAAIRLTRRTSVRARDLRGEPLVLVGPPRPTAPERGGRSAARSAASRRGRRSPARSPRRSGSFPPSPRAPRISFIMLERSRSLRIPGAVYRRFAPPEPTMGIAIGWRRGDNLPTLHRLRELAADVACSEGAPA